MTENKEELLRLQASRPLGMASPAQVEWENGFLRCEARKRKPSAKKRRKTISKNHLSDSFGGTAAAVQTPPLLLAAGHTRAPAALLMAIGAAR